ncbi:tRNA wybutosine-synthesizing protein 4 [Anabrus simplex]|uniref:tRNA wybutosine-synthesizing protein 4 n=1 Tax=Anabrus simplex TaxID=316456 RepID=UPI0035A369DE
MIKTEILIQGTNDFSTISKCSMVQNGYFKDDYIFHFVPHQSRRAPLINIGYYVRAKVIDFTLRTFLQMTQGRAVQIISCGAGFDSNYFRLSGSGTLHSGVIYYEVDFPEVVKRKAESIQNSKSLMDVVGQIMEHPLVILMSRSYRLIAGDLRNLDSLESSLKYAGVNFSLPTLFLSECSITYMDEESSSRLIEWASSKFESASFVTYEQICPDDGFGMIMQKHFENLGSPLLSVIKYTDLAAQRRRYFTRGWTSCSSQSVFDIFTQITDLVERRRVLSLEPFDEFEEWHLKCCHYALTIASNGDMSYWPECLTTSSSCINVPLQLKFQWVLNNNVEGLRRFGHKSVQIDEDNILVVGGFGCSTTEKGHKRLNEVALISYRSGMCSVLNVEPNNIDFATLNCMHHTLTLLYDTQDKKVLLYGGRSSPRKPVNIDPVLFTVRNELVKVSVLRTGGGHLRKPVPRWRHSAVLMNPERVVIFGGRSSELEVLGDLWFFVLSPDFSSVHYQEITANCDVWPCPRFSHSAALVTPKSHKMAITGGIGSNDFIPLCDIWIFDAVSLTWQQLVPAGPGMLPRYGHTSAVFQEKLILIGGVNTVSGQQPGVCLINMKLKTCVEYALPAQNVENPVLLHNHSSEQVEDESQVVIVGGGGNCFSFGTALNKCLVTIDLLQFV